jgi:Holliday junction resolvase RusA-like endonuclease
MGAVRTTQKQKYVSDTYKRYAAYKEHIRLLLSSRIQQIEPYKPISIDVTFYMPIPKNGKTTQNKGGKRTQIKVVEGMAHVKKPDIDNLVKGLFDSLNGLAWVDDAQVFEVSSRKLYSEYPGIELDIKFMD